MMRNFFRFYTIFSVDVLAPGAHDFRHLCVKVVFRFKIYAVFHELHIYKKKKNTNHLAFFYTVPDFGALHDFFMNLVQQFSRIILSLIVFTRNILLYDVLHVK